MCLFLIFLGSVYHRYSIFFLSYLVVSSGGEVRLPSMTEPGPSGDKKRKRAKRVPASVSEGRDYLPRSDLIVQERSPYPVRGNEVHYKKDSDLEEEAEVEGFIVASTEEVVEERNIARMAKTGEESEMAALLRYMRESEDARRTELVEMMRHMRGDDANRQRDEDERRQRNRREDDRVRERRELLQEKLKGLGVYKEGNELGAFLAKFERIMRESAVDERSWAERLYPKLPERMCLRVAQERDEEVEYKEVKRVLLKAAGETAITYGNQLFEANSELFKGKTAGGIAEWLRRVVEGVFQGCKSIEDCRLAIALALLRRVLPQGGKAFVENRKVSEWGELRDSLEDWMSGREKGNFFRPLGGGPSENTRGYRTRESYVGRENVRVGYDKEKGSSASGYLTCFSCGERGHRSTECRKEGKTGGSGYVYRPPTCYSCGKVGHKSTECTARRGAASVKREASPKKMSVLWNAKSGSAGNVAMGLVSGVKTKVLIDSGAELGSVPRAMVPSNVILCNDVRVKGYGGSEKTCKSFMCEFVVGGYRKVVKTIIDESESPGVACIVPFTLVNEEEATAYRCAVSEYEAEEKVGMNVLTRSMAREERELDRNETEDGVIDWWSVVIPDGVTDGVQGPSSQPESLNMPEGMSRVEEGHGVDDAEGSPEADKPQAKGSTENDELEEDSVTSFEEISAGSEVAEFCGVAKELGPVKEGKDREEFKREVMSDESLKEYRERASIRRLDVVVDEQSEESSVLSGICEGYKEEDIQGLLSEYDDVFSEVPGNTERVTMTIDTGDSQPIRQSPYSVPLGIREKVRDELMNLEKCGIIERCDSSWASPLVPVRKSDGGIRLCVDYRKVNAVTEKEPYYIPGFDEMVEKVGTGKVLSKVDLAKGFHQVLVEEKDRDKTCFICPFGKFRFKRMPFGLTNAPSVFQRLMDGVLVGCEEFARVYIDDILVVSQDWKTHLVHLKLLLDTLRQAGLTCKKKKCSFGKSKLEFLGHQIGGGQISVPAARVDAIRKHPLPKTRKQLRSFLGLVGFYRRFIRGFHRWSSTLTPHTSTAMSRVVSWTEPMLDAFHGLCNQLCDSVCLCVPCVSDVFMLESDASSTGVGAVLSVVRKDENVPVAFFSKQLRGAQSR